MKALIDTCVVLDALANREPFYQDAQCIFVNCANNFFEGFLTAKEITDIFYLAHKYTHDNSKTKQAISALCELFSVIDTCSIDIKNALFSDITDFEDAVMIETASRNKFDCIVTRNIKDYEKSNIKVYSPSEFLKKIRE